MRTWKQKTRTVICETCSSPFGVLSEKRNKHCSFVCYMAPRVEINNVSECWEFTGPLAADGYAQMRYDSEFDKGHRLSYRFFNGPTPKGFVVRHLCENKKCLNPDHLSLGSQRDNVNDLSETRGLYNRKGVASRFAKLDDAKVLDIFHSKEHQDTLASKYNVSASTIRDIRSRRSWSHITPGSR